MTEICAPILPSLFTPAQIKAELETEVRRATNEAMMAGEIRTNAEAINAINLILIERPYLLKMTVSMFKRRIKGSDLKLALISMDAIDLLMQKHGPPIQYEVMNSLLQRILKMGIPTTRELSPEQILVKKRAGTKSSFKYSFRRALTSSSNRFSLAHPSLESS